LESFIEKYSRKRPDRGKYICKIIFYVYCDDRESMTFQKKLFCVFVLNTALFLLLPISLVMKDAHALILETMLLSLVGFSLNVCMFFPSIKWLKSATDQKLPDEKSQEEIMSDLDQEVTRRREIAKLEKN